MAVNPIPEGMSGVIAHLTVKGAAEAIEFYKKAFGAEEIMRMPMSACPGGDPADGRLTHAQLRIGSSVLFLADDFPEYCGGQSRHPQALGGTPITLHQYVRDVDAAIDRAAKAGATVTMPAEDMFWGDRYGVVTDPFGHQWSLATRISEQSA